MLVSNVGNKFHQWLIDRISEGLAKRCGSFFFFPACVDLNSALVVQFCASKLIVNRDIFVVGSALHSTSDGFTFTRRWVIL